MKKSKKQIREEREKSALRKRVADIATGAAGYEFDDDDNFATADFLERFVPALKIRFGFEREESGRKIHNGYLFETNNLSNYENVDSATEFLFTQGVRASC